MTFSSIRESVDSPSFWRPSWIEIDLDAIGHNLKQVQFLLSGTETRLLGVVKADAYGAGAVPVARVLEAGGIDRLGVVTLEEGIQLRRAGITCPILNMGTLFPDQVMPVVEHDLEQMVFQSEVAHALSREAERQGKTVHVHYKIDTGMSRYGVRFDRAADVFTSLRSIPHLDWVGAMSHFANSDGLDKSFPLLQLSRFQTVRRQFEEKKITIPLWHICNSGGTLDLPEARQNMVRVGLMLYGYYPSTDVQKPLDLKPAFSLKSSVVTERNLNRGDSLGYGRRYMAEQPERIGVLPLGYADGYDRKLRNRGQVLWAGQRLPIIGGLCMDACFVHLTDVPDCTEGSEVTVIGHDGDDVITPHDVAGWAESVSYEVMARLGKRLPRVYMRGDTIDHIVKSVMAGG